MKIMNYIPSQYLYDVVRQEVCNLYLVAVILRRCMSYFAGFGELKIYNINVDLIHGNS
jgi:hypothetical protein